jgi:cytochrome c biogenesis protein CcdA
VLAGVLSYAAYAGRVPYEALLLFLFGLGAGAPVLLAGTAAGGMATRLDRAGLRPWVDRVTGAALLGVGFYLLWTA